MTTQEIANFIKTQLKMGSTRAEVEKILSLNRVAPQDIAASFELAMSEAGSAPTPTPAVAPGMTGIGMPPKAVPGSATPDRAFPPPAMSLNSIDSVTPAPAPVPPPSTPPATIQPPPIVTQSAPAQQTASVSALRPIMPNPISVKPPTPPSFRPLTPSPINMAMPLAQPVVQKSGGHWLLFIFILIILGLGGTGAYAYIMKPAWAEPFMTPILNLIRPTTPPVVIEPIPEAPIIPVDPTADWQTYNDDKFGFEFKYPTDLTISTSSKGLIGLKSVATSTASSTSTSTPITFDSNIKGLVLTDLTYQNIFDQINSTFKLIGPVATSTATSTISTSTTPASTSTEKLPPPVDLPSLFLPETN